MALRAPAMGRHGTPTCWVFGYASLIWRPEFDAAEHRTGPGARLAPCVAHALAHQPRHARAARAGLCAAAGRRLPRHGLPAARRAAEAELDRLWAREMPTGVYDARWLPCRTPQGTVAALAFTLSRRSEACTGRALPDERDAAHPAPRPRPLRQHAGLPGRDRRGAAPAPRARPRDRAPDGAGRAGTAWSRNLARRHRRPAVSAGRLRGRATARRRASRSASVSTSTSTPGSSTSTPCGRIARHHAARAFVAAQQHQFGKQFGGKAHRVAASAAVLRIRPPDAASSALATASSWPGCTSGMSPGSTSQPRAPGRAATPAAIE